MRYKEEEINDILIDGYIYCCKCNKAMDHLFPYLFLDGYVYCGECAFIQGLINEKTYCDECLRWLNLDGKRAVVKDGVIHITYGNKKFQWEKTKQQLRHSKEYIKWRNNVFKRDKYVCQICNKLGGNLNAHHIKSFKSYPDLRLNVDNGITLCEECHKKVHKGEIDGLYTN